MVLSEDDLRYFRTFGFIRLRGFFTNEEVATIEEEFGRGLAAASDLYPPMAEDGRDPHQGLVNWSGMRPDTPFLAESLEHQKLLGAADDVLGRSIGIMNNGALYPAEFSVWHSDTDWEPDEGMENFRGMKFFCYLEPLRGDNGALRVLPGSQLSSWHDIVKEYKRTATDDGESLNAVLAWPAVICESEPGDLIGIDLRIWHASANGFPGRRLCTFIYFAEPTSEDEERSAAKVASQYKQGLLMRDLRRRRAWRRTRPDVPHDEIPALAPQFPRAPSRSVSTRRGEWDTWLERWGLGTSAGSP